MQWSSFCLLITHPGIIVWSVHKTTKQNQQHEQNSSFWLLVSVIHLGILIRMCSSFVSHEKLTTVETIDSTPILMCFSSAFFNHFTSCQWRSLHHRGTVCPLWKITMFWKLKKTTYHQKIFNLATPSPPATTSFPLVTVIAWPRRPFCKLKKVGNH